MTSQQIGERRHCGNCQYFGERNNEVVQFFDGEIAVMHHCNCKKSIFKAAQKTATGCCYYEEDQNAGRE